MGKNSLFDPILTVSSEQPDVSLGCNSCRTVHKPGPCVHELPFAGFDDEIS